MREKAILMGMAAAGLAVLAAVLLFDPQGSARKSQSAVFFVPGSQWMNADTAFEKFHVLTPALLLEVYKAFGETKEDEIYDTLARVTDGDALEYLYLERIGAMAGGGLEEADQTIHEIKLLNTGVSRADNTLNVDALWQVIGTVGHAEHMHVRGNTYRADLVIAPVGTAWKITDFELLEVTRDQAGETFAAPETN